MFSKIISKIKLSMYKLTKITKNYKSFIDSVIRNFSIVLMNIIDNGSQHSCSRRCNLSFRCIRIYFGTGVGERIQPPNGKYSITITNNQIKKGGRESMNWWWTVYSTSKKSMSVEQTCMHIESWTEQPGSQRLIGYVSKTIDMTKAAVVKCDSSLSTVTKTSWNQTLTIFCSQHQADRRP